MSLRPGVFLQDMGIFHGLAEKGPISQLPVKELPGQRDTWGGSSAAKELHSMG
jgi:hypothetical protein